MNEPIDIEATKAWLDSLPGGQIGRRLADSWEGFSAIDEPVVTIYGSYDTGKSSLLRRLLIELGLTVPPWLTISARHETFEVNAIRAGGCMLRDTPGFVVEGTDARAELNTELAAEAILLTDVAVITVPPQLATAEHPVLLRLVHQAWVPGALWFVISRFDEAGVDPEDDLDGYRELAKRKTRELRAALHIANDVPVHVVCPDFAQMAGSDRNPDPHLWDESRDWDGINALLSAIVELGSAGRSGLREAAEQRFWRNAVQRALEGLAQELQRHLDNAVVSDEGDQRRRSWLAQLDTLVRAAEAELRGIVSAAIGDAMDSDDPQYVLAASLKLSVGAWHSAAERDMDKLLRNVGETIATDRARPDWQQFDDLAAKLRRGPSDETPPSEERLTYTPVIEAIGDAVLVALRHYRSTTRLKPVDPSPSEGRDPLAIAAVGIALVGQLASIAERFNNEQRQVKREHADLRLRLTTVGDEALALGVVELGRLADHARQRIYSATADQADLHDALHHMVGQLREMITAGEALLGV